MIFLSQLFFYLLFSHECTTAALAGGAKLRNVWLGHFRGTLGPSVSSGPIFFEESSHQILRKYVRNPLNLIFVCSNISWCFTLFAILAECPNDELQFNSAPVRTLQSLSHELNCAASSGPPTGRHSIVGFVPIVPRAKPQIFRSALRAAELGLHGVVTLLPVI